MLNDLFDSIYQTLTDTFAILALLFVVNKCGEDYDKSVYYQPYGTQHPYGIKMCPQCKKYGMVRLERFPQVHDEIFKYKIPNCNNDGGKPALYYKQMSQHEKVCQKEIPEILDPIDLVKIPFFSENSSTVKLIDHSKLNEFYNNDIDFEEEKLNITLTTGFKVCILQNTNHVMIVGGVGTEYNTYLFNMTTNLIENTKWKLKIPRVSHSLCSADNMLIGTGTKVRGKRDVDRQGCSTEVFSLEWDEWREGLEMYNERFDHLSIVLGNKVWAIFGNDPLNSGSAQDGIEYVSLNQVTKNNVVWRYIDGCTK